MEIGGGFGGKNRIYCEPIAAMLAKQGRPSSQAHDDARRGDPGERPHVGHLYPWASWRDEGRHHRRFQLWMAYEAGAFPGSPVGGGINTSLGKYAIPNVRLDGYDVVVNRPRNAAYRAPGVPAPISSSSRLSTSWLNVSISTRSTCASRTPQVRALAVPNGVVIGSNGHTEVIEALRNHPHYRSELTGTITVAASPLASGMPAPGQHSLNATVNSDGSVTVNIGAIDIGGGLRASPAMTIAEVLGIPYENVHPRVVDTDSIGYTTISAGSGTGSGISASVYNAA